MPMSGPCTGPPTYRCSSFPKQEKSIKEAGSKYEQRGSPLQADMNMIQNAVSPLNGVEVNGHHDQLRRPSINHTVHTMAMASPGPISAPSSF